MHGDCYLFKESSARFFFQVILPTADSPTLAVLAGGFLGSHEKCTWFFGLRGKIYCRDVSEPRTNLHVAIEPNILYITIGISQYVRMLHVCTNLARHAQGLQKNKIKMLKIRLSRDSNLRHDLTMPSNQLRQASLTIIFDLFYLIMFIFSTASIIFQLSPIIDVFLAISFSHSCIVTTHIVSTIVSTNSLS